MVPPAESSTVLAAEAAVAPVVLLDLDGVVWLAHQPIEGAVDGIARLRAGGFRVLFVTNNSASTIAEQEGALEAIGVPARGDVLTSALAGAVLVEPGDRVLVCGGPGVTEAVLARDATVVTDWPCEAVVVGFHRTFDYDSLRRAAGAAFRGATLIGTNDDATYPTPDGPIPGGGAILAAVAVGSGVTPVVAGKPYAPMARLVRSIVGDAAAASAVMVGDRPSTDGRFAVELGCRYAQVWSGVTPFGADVEPTPHLTGAHLGQIADQLLAERAAR
jgi:HAD superfamily hydrolase (TIGR01450 family)